MRGLLVVLAAVFMLGHHTNAIAISDEEDAVTCNISASTLVAGWNQCSNGPFPHNLGVSDIYGEIKFLSTVYSGIGDVFFFNCGTSGQIFVDGWELVSIPTQNGSGQYQYLINLHVSQINSCVGDQQVNLSVLAVAP